MYSKSALARLGRAPYLDMLSRARLMKGPSGVDSMDACNTKTSSNCSFSVEVVEIFDIKSQMVLQQHLTYLGQFY